MPTIDIHAHAAPLDELEAMRDICPDVVPDLQRHGETVFFCYPSGVVNGPIPRSVVDLDVRLAQMDEAGVDHQVLSARPQMFTYALPASTAARLAALSNDSLVRTAGQYPDRLSTMISLPLQSTAESVAEVERWADKRIVRGVLIDSNIAGRDFADAELQPVWAAVEEADLAVLVHPYQADVVGMERLRSHYLFNLIGNPFDTTIAIANVVFGGMVERHPELRWGFVHGGGVAPYLLGRWDHGWHVREVTRELIPDVLPSELLAGFWYDCLVHDVRTLRYLAEVVGWDRIMLGSDCPFDMGCVDPVGFATSTDLSSDVAPMVLGANAERFLRSPDG
jgi:aminocarboxymuconate-semialdehyde decarboxylase